MQLEYILGDFKFEVLRGFAGQSVVGGVSGGIDVLGIKLANYYYIVLISLVAYTL